jgi:CubicO group peptidase (beta-lactamase class C family)
MRETMMQLVHPIIGLLGTILATGWPTSAARADTPRSAQALTGLWRAERRFGPEIQGALTIRQTGDGWTAQIMGRHAPVKLDGDSISFELPYKEGAFRGWLRDGKIIGHWIQPNTVSQGCAYASPVSLERRRPGRWVGLVRPLVDRMTYYLSITANADGKFGAFLRNPERNRGLYVNAQHVTADGRVVKLWRQASKGSPEAVVADGTYDPDNQVISISLPSSGGTFDFHRASAAEEAAFLPRGKAHRSYAYSPPCLEDDGWPVATVEDVGIARDAVSRFIRMLIDTPIDSVHASEIHGVLIARHGKLVLEEYFHGFHRDALHDTRSASKTLTSALTGAAIQRGESLSASTSVYKAMETEAALAKLDSRKRVMTVEHLLTMSSGLDCDDSDDKSVGNEDTMQDQTAQPDWYRYTLDLKMVRNPGEKAVYGSANPNLLGGVLARTTHRWLPDLFHDLIAEPLGIRHYAMNLTPTGDAYMGGGTQFQPRDFMKLGQMILDGGRWHDKQIVSAEWAKRSISPLYELRGLHYGYLWWVIEYPYKGRTIRAFFAGGNGGQIVMGIPELDLVIAFYGGNYGDPVLFVPQREYVPKYILPAVN